MRFPQMGEVAWMANRLRPRVLGKTIKEVTTGPNLSARMITPLEELKKMEGKKVNAVNRWGKILWMELDQQPHPAFRFYRNTWLHFSDLLTVPREDTPKVWPPTEFQVLWKFEDSPIEVALTEQGRPGVSPVGTNIVTMCDVAEDENYTGLRPPRSCFMNKDLAPARDAVLEPFTPETIKPLLKTRMHTPLKRWLQNPNHVAGFGDWITDQILFQSRLHPGLPVRRLEEDDIVRLCDTINSVARIAVEAEGDDTKLPDDWLKNFTSLDTFEDRFTFRGEVPGVGPIEAALIQNSLALFVPAVQKLPEDMDWKPLPPRRRSTRAPVQPSLEENAQ